MEWNVEKGGVLTRIQILPIDGKGHCVECARIFLHEKQANRTGGSVCRQYYYVYIKTPQLQLVSALRVNQGIRRGLTAFTFFPSL